MKRLREYALAYGLAMSDHMLEKFDLYMHMLVDWNQRINLTAITQPEEIEIKHFLDSLLIINAIHISEAAKVVDVGTGAGFPGIPLKIVRPDINLTLLDSLNKRIVFLQQLSDALGQRNACLHGRAEEAGRDQAMRSQFEIVTARAVATLPILAEYCLPLVEVNGIFIAMKGPEVREEIAASQRALQELGAELDDVKEYHLPNGHERTIVIIKKISQTSAKYPRTAAKITKSPL